MTDAPTEPQNPNDTVAVTEFIAKLDSDLKTPVREIRQLIIGADPRVGERIKWNHPAFYYTGPMPPSDPKAYAREIVVFNLYRGRLMLVFTHGAGLPDPSGLLEGSFRDGRRTLTFKSLEDFRAKATALTAIIQDWVARANQA